MKSKYLIPVFYQGQPCGPDAEPDHYVTREESKRGRRAEPPEYLCINNRKALVKLITCLPKYPGHRDSIKAGWQGVSQNMHSFKFRRDFGALQRRLGPRVMQLVRVATTQKHSKTHLPQRVSYSPNQAKNTNGHDPGRVVPTRACYFGEYTTAVP